MKKSQEQLEVEKKAFRKCYEKQEALKADSFFALHRIVDAAWQILGTLCVDEVDSFKFPVELSGTWRKRITGNIYASSVKEAIEVAKDRVGKDLDGCEYEFREEEAWIV